MRKPYTQHVIAPIPGWVDGKTWQGVYTVTPLTGDGTHTIRVTDATDSTGFVIPEDTSHQFVIDTQAALGANNGLAIPVGQTAMYCTWSISLDPERVGIRSGYNLLRSTDGVNYVQANTSVVPTNEYLDTDLQSGTLYFYKVHEEGQSDPIAVFYGMTEAEPLPPLPVDEWGAY